MTKDEWSEIQRKDKFKWMSDDQWACYEMLCDLFGGNHHIYGPVKPWGSGIEHNTRQDFSTFDFNRLTHAVIMAHDRMIRFSIGLSQTIHARRINNRTASDNGRSNRNIKTITSSSSGRAAEVHVGRQVYGNEDLFLQEMPKIRL